MAPMAMTIVFSSSTETGLGGPLREQGEHDIGRDNEATRDKCCHDVDYVVHVGGYGERRDRRPTSWRWTHTARNPVERQMHTSPPYLYISLTLGVANTMAVALVTVVGTLPEHIRSGMPKNTNSAVTKGLYPPPSSPLLPNELYSCRSYSPIAR